LRLEGPGASGRVLGEEQRAFSPPQGSAVLYAGLICRFTVMLLQVVTLMALEIVFAGPCTGEHLHKHPTVVILKWPNYKRTALL